MRRQLGWSTLLLAACLHRPATTSRAEAAGSGLDPDGLRRRLHAFAHDSMEGRLAGSAGNFRATTYVAAEFRRIGLRPAGENGGPYQAIPLVERTLDSSSSFATSRGTVRVGTEFLPINLNVLGRVDAEAVFAGDLTDPAGWLGETAIAGRLAVLAVPRAQRAFVPAAWLADRRFAAAAAIAVVQLELVAPGSAAAIASTPQRHLANSQSVSASSRRVPRFYFARSAAERLWGRDLSTLRVGERLGRATLDVRAGERPMKAAARNVIGMLPGSDPALRGEFVVVGAHNDHVGIAAAPVDHDSLRAFNTVMRPRGANDTPGAPTPRESTRIAALLDSLRSARPRRSDSIFNGAMDDGGGTVTLIAVAEAMRATPARRSILFVSHTAEEVGLLGSAWFTEHPTVPLGRIVAMVNLDSYGGDGRAPGSERVAADYLQVVGARRIAGGLGDLIDSLNRTRSRTLALDYSLDASGHPLDKYCRSDHANYARFGIPVAFFSTGFNRDYHQLTDEAEYTDFAYLARLGAFVRDVVTAIADRPGRFGPDSALAPPKAPCRQ